MKLFKLMTKSAYFSLVMLLTTTGTAYNAKAGGSINTCAYGGNGCQVASTVNCNYIDAPTDTTRFSYGVGSGSSNDGAVYLLPPDSEKCAVDSAATVDGVAPPFVPPDGVVYAYTVVDYIHNDALGSPVAATNIDGALLWSEEYRPYGTRIKKEDTSNNSQWFTGKPHEEEFGLSYFGARWYDPESGRFMGVDPIEVDPLKPSSFSKYTYANNNPYAFIDPDGRDALFLSAFRRDVHSIDGAIEHSAAFNKTLLVTGTLIVGGASAADAATDYVNPIKGIIKRTIKRVVTKGLSKPLKNKMKRIRNQTAAGGNRGVSGSVSNDDAMRLGQEFVGPGYRMMSSGKGYVSADGLRTFRFPTKKRGINPATGQPWSRTGRQVNFETKAAPGETPISNVHLDVF